MKTTHDGDVITLGGRTFHLEMVENGLLRTYDYGCQWFLTFVKVGGVWMPRNMNAMSASYKELVDKLNERTRDEGSD